jgi:hypothetical protein
MRRLALYFLPAAAAAAAIFGLFYGWIGFQAIRGGAGWVGYLLLVFGFGGITLGTALWTAWRKVVEQIRSDSAAADKNV